MFYAQNLSDWISLFETLLPHIPIDIHIAADEKGEEYVVVKPINAADLSTIQQTLQHSFHSPQTFRSHLPYELNAQPRVIAIPAQAIRQVPKPDDTLKAGVQIFVRLFERGISELSIDTQELFKRGSVKDGVLYSKPLQRLRAATQLRTTVEALVSYFKDATLDTIRNAFEGIASLPEPIDDSDSSLGLVKGLVQQCFFVKTTQEGRQVIGFNFGLLHSLLYPPTFEPPVASSPELWIKTSHLIPYLSMLTQGDENGGVLLRAVKDGQTQNTFLRPMLFYHETTPKNSAYYELLLDCSASMSPYLPELKTRVKEFIAQLHRVEPDAIIRMVPFSSPDQYNADIMSPKEFNIKDEASIQSYINLLIADGATPLFKTLGREIEILAKKGADDLHLKGKRLRIVLFTDGDDTEAKHEDEKMPRITRALEQFDQMGQQRPKIKTLGFGNCNAKILALIGQATNTKFEYLKDLADFNKVLEDKRLLMNHRLLRFLYTVGEQTKQVSTVVHSDSLTIPDVYIPFEPGKAIVVSLGNNKFSVKVDEPSLLPEMTYTDRISILLSEVRTLFLDKSKASQERINQLLSKREAIQTLTAINDNQRALQVMAFDEISEYITGLQDSVTDSALRSLYSQAEMAQRASVTNVAAPRALLTSSTNIILTQFLAQPGSSNDNQMVAVTTSPGQSTTSSTTEAPPFMIALSCTFERVKNIFGDGTINYEVVDGFHHYTYMSGDGAELGHAMLKGQASFCYYSDGTHNLIKADGVFQSFFPCLPDAKHAQICQTPADHTMTLAQGILSGVPVGVCSGVSHVFAKHLEQKQIGTSITRTLAQKASCYGLYWSFSFTSGVALDHMKGTYMPWTSESRAAVSAAVDTLYLGTAELASHVLSKTFSWLSQAAKKQSRQKTAQFCSGLSKAASFLLWAPPAIRSGNPTVVLASAGSSALTRIATEAVVGAAVLKPKVS